MAFKPITFNGNYSLIVATDGLPRTGKTRFAATAPDPIGVLINDRNSRWTFAKHAEETGKKIVGPDRDFIRVEEPIKLARLSVDDAIKYYRKHVDDFKMEYFRMLDDKSIRTIVIDTGTQLSEDILFANYGRNLRVMPRDRGAYNQEIKDMLVACNKNLIVIHQSREVWVNDQVVPGKYERTGYKRISYEMNVCVQHFKDKATHNKDCAGSENGCVCYGIRIGECQANPELDGEKIIGRKATFPHLARRIFPDSDLDDWR